MLILLILSNSPLLLVVGPGRRGGPCPGLRASSAQRPPGSSTGRRRGRRGVGAGGACGLRVLGRPIQARGPSLTPSQRTPRGGAGGGEGGRTAGTDLGRRRG